MAVINHVWRSFLQCSLQRSFKYSCPNVWLDGACQSWLIRLSMRAVSPINLSCWLDGRTDGWTEFLFFYKYVFFLSFKICLYQCSAALLSFLWASFHCLVLFVVTIFVLMGATAPNTEWILLVNWKTKPSQEESLMELLSFVIRELRSASSSGVL